MTTTDTQPAANTGRVIASAPDTSRAWWFLDTLVVLRNPEGAPLSPAVIEMTLPPGASPPLHIHDGLDDSFLMLEGEIVVRCGEQTLLAGPGSYVALPAGTPHTFRVVSPAPARMLLIHADDSFLGFIEAVGARTTELRLPRDGEVRVDPDVLMGAAGDNDLRIIGPSLEEDEARQFTR